MRPKVRFSLAKASELFLLTNLCCLNDQLVTSPILRVFLFEGPYHSRVVRACRIPGNARERMSHIVVSRGTWGLRLLVVLLRVLVFVTGCWQPESSVFGCQW